MGAWGVAKGRACFGIVIAAIAPEPIVLSFSRFSEVSYPIISVYGLDGGRHAGRLQTQVLAYREVFAACLRGHVRVHFVPDRDPHAASPSLLANAFPLVQWPPWHALDILVRVLRAGVLCRAGHGCILARRSDR